MSNTRDRTNDFRELVRSVAISLGYDESKLATISTSLIMSKPRERSSFIKSALLTLQSIDELERFIVKHRKDYIEPHRATEQERDSIEHEVGVFIKTCKEQIDILKDTINVDDKKNSRLWLSNQVHPHADVIAHKHGVVLILSERLHSVTSLFDQLRAIRFQDAIDKAMPRRLRHRTVKTVSAESSKPADLMDTQSGKLQPEFVNVQQQVLDDETRALQVELSSLLDAVQETETKMIEMSALNHLMSTHVLQQAQQIEYLYDQAVQATSNVVLGNKEISKAIERNRSSRTFLLLFFIVLPLSLLFLDWYQ
ncbi:Syntaxin [Nymphaea thermarum]|nr:Syntaxin [Nymphaea thermarum]